MRAVALHIVQIGSPIASLILSGCVAMVAGKPDSTAVAVARAHINAWSTHNYQLARTFLADDVKVFTTTTQPIMKGDVNTSGAEVYMTGLKQFADGVEAGSAQVLSAIGDERNALILLTVRASFAPGAPKVTLAAARLYLIDDKKIVSEKEIFYAAGN